VEASIMSKTIDVKRIVIFLAIAFGIAWAAGLVVYLTGGLKESPELIPGTGITLALVLVAVAYMWAPAVAHVFTRVITREGWKNTFLRPHFRRGWPLWIAAWFLPAVLTIVGAVVYFLFFPQYFDSSLASIQQSLDNAAQQAGQAVPLTPVMVIVVNTLIGVLVAPLINSLFTFGEEFGWRSYLLGKLMPLGGRKAMILMGLIWGVWHWPLIVMGHNYGAYTLDYPGAPWTGMLAMVWFCFICGVLLSWMALRGGSVWPAVIGHAAINGIASIGVLFVKGEPNMVLGPTPAGLVGSVAFSLAAIWIFASRTGLASPDKPAAVTAAPDDQVVATLEVPEETPGV
jgi:membrane protease YdiL (CAAX protease family)